MKWSASSSYPLTRPNQNSAQLMVSSGPMNAKDSTNLPTANLAAEIKPSSSESANSTNVLTRLGRKSAQPIVSSGAKNAKDSTNLPNANPTAENKTISSKSANSSALGKPSKSSLTGQSGNHPVSMPTQQQGSQSNQVRKQDSVITKKQLPKKKNVNFSNSSIS